MAGSSSSSYEVNMHVIAFKSSVLQFSFDVQHRKDDPQVKMKLFQFCHSKRTFRMTMEKIVPLGFSATELEVVTVKYLLNSLTGVYQPCMLLHQLQTKPSGKKRTVIYHVLLFEGFESLFLLGSFEIERTNNLQLVDGPAVCWVVEGTVNFAHYDSTIENFTVDSVKIDISPNNTLDQYFTVLWCGILNMEVVSMGVKSEITDEETTSALARWTCVNHSQGTIQEVPLVPDIYAAIGTSCLIKESFRAVKQGCSNTVYDRLDVYLTTIRGQLLKFVDGLLKNCWQLPFSDPHKIWMVEPEHDEVVIIIQSRRRMVCAVNSRKKQVVKEWDGIETVLIDDFLQSGTDQVLFFPIGFTISETEEFSKFMLVDIARGMMSVEHSQEASHVDSQQPKTDSLQKTARALRTQLQAQAAALNESKLECDAKLRMLEHSCKVLKAIISSSSPTRRKMAEKLPGLFCLLEGAVDDGAELQNPGTNLKSSLTVTETWQRVISDQWVVGVDVENCGESPVSDLVLGLVNSQPEQVEYSSKPVLWGNNIRFHDEMETISPSVNTRSYNNGSPSLKRKKASNAETAKNQQLLFPGKQTSLTVLSSVPTFKFIDKYSRSVVLTWKSHDNDGRVVCRAMHCGYVTLQTDQIINGGLHVNRHSDKKSIQQDIVALRSSSIETESDKSCVQRLVPLVKRTLGVPVLQTEDGSGSGSSPGIYVQLLAAVGDNSPLAGAGIVLHSGIAQGRLTLIARNENQMYMVLHKLRQVLPDDVALLPDPTLERLAVQSGLSALNDEITTLQQGLHRVFHKTRQGVHKEAGKFEKRDHDVETKHYSVQSLREGLERKREREMLENEEFLSNEQEELEKLWNDLIREQMATDHSVGKMLNF